LNLNYLISLRGVSESLSELQFEFLDNSRGFGHTDRLEPSLGLAHDERPLAFVIFIDLSEGEARQQGQVRGLSHIFTDATELLENERVIILAGSDASLEHLAAAHGPAAF